MAAESFITVKAFGRDEFTEKKSRFIGSCAPVSDEAEAIAFVNRIRSEFPDARHNVYAYITSKNGVLSQRYSDDGEPQGTGGMPVLEAMRRTNVTNAAIVVTRYFGGILLGASGLTRAYGEGAKIAIQAANPIKMEHCREYEITTDYSLFSRVKRVLESYRCIIKPPAYSQDVTINVIVPCGDSGRLLTDITDVTSDLALEELVGDGFYNIE